MHLSPNDVERFAVGALLVAAGTSEAIYGYTSTAQWLGVFFLVGAWALMLVDFVRVLLGRDSEREQVTFSELPAQAAVVGLALALSIAIGASGILADVVDLVPNEELEVCRADVTGRSMSALPRAYNVELNVQCGSTRWQQGFPVTKGFFAQTRPGTAVRVSARPHHEKAVRIFGAQRVVVDSYESALIAGPVFVLIWVAGREFAIRIFLRRSSQSLDKD